jgi:hypothetical protein
MMAIQLTNSTLAQTDQMEVQRVCDCIYKLRSLALDFYEYTYVKTLSLYQSSGRLKPKLILTLILFISYFPQLIH